MEPAKIFGIDVESWVWLFVSLLATVAVIVAARQKKRRWAELGDGEGAWPPDAAERDHRHDRHGGGHPPR